jgi:hypothetical protein
MGNFEISPNDGMADSVMAFLESELGVELTKDG